LAVCIVVSSDPPLVWIGAGFLCLGTGGRGDKGTRRQGEWVTGGAGVWRSDGKRGRSPEVAERVIGQGRALVRAIEGLSSIDDCGLTIDD